MECPYETSFIYVIDVRVFRAQEFKKTIYWKGENTLVWGF